MRCNKKSLSLSIANGRLRDTTTQQNKIHKGGSAECQYPNESNYCDVSQLRVETLNFKKQSKQLSSQHQSTTYSSNYFRQIIRHPNNKSHRSPIHGAQEDSTFASNFLSPNSNMCNNPKMGLESQQTPNRKNSNGETNETESALQLNQNGNRLVLKSNANSSPDSTNQNHGNNKREAASDDSPRNMYNRLTVRRRSYDQNLQNLSRVKQSSMFKKKRGSPGSKGSPTLIKRQQKEGAATSRSVQGPVDQPMTNFKPKTLRLGDIAAANKRAERNHKQ